MEAKAIRSSEILKLIPQSERERIREFRENYNQFQRDWQVYLKSKYKTE